MFDRETFIVRVAEDAMAPRVRVGDYVWVDSDEPAADGRLVAVREPDRSGETGVRLLVERDGHRTLRGLDERCPERTVDAGNETDIWASWCSWETPSERRRHRAVRIGDGAGLASTPSPPRPPCGEHGPAEGRAISRRSVPTRTASGRAASQRDRCARRRPPPCS